MAKNKSSKRAQNTRMVWIDTELHGKLKEKASEDRRTIRSTLEMIIEDYLEDELAA